MSTVIYYVAAHCLSKVYTGIDGGEFTNPDRVFKPISPFHEKVNTKLKEEGVFWSNKHYNLITDLYEHLHKLDRTIVLKEVVYPHILADFVRDNKAKAIIVEKEIPLTAYSLMKNGWFYPTRLLYEKDPKGIERLKGLLKSLQYVWINHFNPLIHKDHVETITAENMVFDTQKLFDKIERLGFKPRRFGYMNDTFRKKYPEVQAYKETELYKQILKVWRDIK